MATQKGMSLFPVSVEVANSLLRVCETFDSLELHDTFGSDSLGLFRRYSQWLRARTVTFSYKFCDEPEKVVGWHSENIDEPDVIHLWQTSQVLEFFLGFYRLLQAHIARTTLIRSRFNVKPFVPDSGVRWDKIREEFEPVTRLGANYEVYTRLGKEFVAGWAVSEPRSYSMLLYGPPGTGKTTVAWKLAEALGFRLITITVSDFLAEGGGQIEARAKAIFDVLRAQSNCIILFDEIDNFLLDRDTERYAKQETVFQFMTPGMLTKLDDLRRDKRSIFAIGTNYENRIDPAIKRAGRIDQRYLVLPPDGNARKRTMIRIISSFNEKCEIIQPTDNEWTWLIANSVFLSIREIENAILTAIDNKDSWTRLADSLLDSPRTIRLSMFRNRLPDPKDKTAIGESERWPLEEFICLLALALEADKKEFLDRETCLAAKNTMGRFTDREDATHKVVERTSGLPKEVADIVSNYLFDLND